MEGSFGTGYSNWSRSIEESFKIYSREMAVEGKRNVRENATVRLEMYVNNLITLSIVTSLLTLSSAFFCWINQRLMYERLTELLEALMLLSLF